MVTSDELLARICADPDDDAARLVYADWLQERGDPRGEYIALMVHASRMPRWDPGRIDLEEQARGRLNKLRKPERRHRHEWYDARRPPERRRGRHPGRELPFPPPADPGPRARRARARRPRPGGALQPSS